MSDAHRSSNAARFLKTLVAAGASLGLSSCGGESRRTLDAGPGGTAGAGGVQSMGATGGMAGAGGAAAGHTGNVETCAHSSQRVCTCSYAPPITQRCTLNHPFDYYGPSLGYQLQRMDCVCEASRPSGPEACAYTQEFTCAEYDPEYEACFCNEDAPKSQEDCRGNEYFRCHDLDLRIGCECVARIV